MRGTARRAGWFAELLSLQGVACLTACLSSPHAVVAESAVEVVCQGLGAEDGLDISAGMLAGLCESQDANVKRRLHIEERMRQKRRAAVGAAAAAAVAGEGEAPPAGAPSTLLDAARASSSAGGVGDAALSLARALAALAAGGGVEGGGGSGSSGAERARGAAMLLTLWLGTCAPVVEMGVAAEGRGMPPYSTPPPAVSPVLSYILPLWLPLGERGSPGVGGGGGDGGGTPTSSTWASHPLRLTNDSLKLEGTLAHLYPCHLPGTLAFDTLAAPRTIEGDSLLVPVGPTPAARGAGAPRAAAPPASASGGAPPPGELNGGLSEQEALAAAIAASLEEAKPPAQRAAEALLGKARERGEELEARAARVQQGSSLALRCSSASGGGAKRALREAALGATRATFAGLRGSAVGSGVAVASLPALLLLRTAVRLQRRAHAEQEETKVGEEAYLDLVGRARKEAFEWRDLGGECNPIGVAAVPAPWGGVVVADNRRNKIYYFEQSGGRGRLVAGSGEEGHVDGPARSAQFNAPYGVAVAQTGEIFVADTSNHRIRYISSDYLSGLESRVATLSGGGQGAHADGADNAALFEGPTSIAVDPREPGTIFIVDHEGNGYVRRLRVLDPWGAPGSRSTTDTVAAGFRAPRGISEFCFVNECFYVVSPSPPTNSPPPPPSLLTHFSAKLLPHSCPADRLWLPQIVQNVHCTRPSNSEPLSTGRVWGTRSCGRPPAWPRWRTTALFQ